VPDDDVPDDDVPDDDVPDDDVPADDVPAADVPADDVPDDDPPATVARQGDGIIGAAWWGTGVFVLVAVAAAGAPDTFGTAVLYVDVGLFVAGCVLFAVAFLRAAARSRTDAIGIGGLFFLAGDVAPPDVRLRLLGPLVVQTVVGVVTAGVRLYTNLAAGILVPVFGLGLCGLWAARYGRFGRRAGDSGAKKPG
jgi:hypothetical protein